MSRPQVTSISPEETSSTAAKTPPPPSRRRIVIFWICGVIIAASAVLSPWPLLAKLRAIGAAVDAQLPSHTLLVGGQLMPLSSRNMGIYLGVALAVCLILATGRGRSGYFPPRRVIIALGAMLSVMMADGFNSLLQTLQATHPNYHPLYPPSNDVRVVTGVLSGVALGVLSYSYVSSLVWRAPEQEAVMEDLTDLSGYVVGAILLAMIVLRRLPILFYPLSILSVTGELLMLTLVNTAILTISLRRERKGKTLGDVAIMAILALTVGLIEIIVLNVLRTLSGG